MLSIRIPKSPLPQFQILMELAPARQRARQRTDYVETPDNSVDKPESSAREVEDSEEKSPQKLGKNEDVAVQQMLEEGITARDEDEEENNPQELGRDENCLEKQMSEEKTIAREEEVEGDNPEEVGKEDDCLERSL